MTTRGQPASMRWMRCLNRDLVAEHLSAADGRPASRWPPSGSRKRTLLDPESLRKVKPEEEFEGYTGNAGMTLDRWYRHAAVVLWPQRTHFDVLCDAGLFHAVPALEAMVRRWQGAAGTEAERAAVRVRCVRHRHRPALAGEPGRARRQLPRRR